MGTTRWQDAANIAVGVWLIVSPWLLGIGEDEFAEAWNLFAVGGAIILLSALALPLPGNWEEIINIALGIWLVASPWVLEFANHRLVAANSVIAGILVVSLAAWAMARTPHPGMLQRDRHAAP